MCTLVDFFFLLSVSLAKKKIINEQSDLVISFTSLSFIGIIVHWRRNFYNGTNPTFCCVHSKYTANNYYDVHNYITFINGKPKLYFYRIYACGDHAPHIHMSHHIHTSRHIYPFSSGGCGHKQDWRYWNKKVAQQPNTPNWILHIPAFTPTQMYAHSFTN